MNKLKKGIAFVIALCMIFSIFTNVSVAQAATKKSTAKTVTVRTQKEFNKALKDGKATTIKVVTSKNVKLVIPKGTKASGVQLVINAPKAQVIASASVKLDVKSDAAVTLKKGAEGTTVKVSGKAKVKLVNKTAKKVTVTTPFGKTEVGAGKTVADVAAQNKKVNLIANGDFSNGKDGFDVYTAGGGSETLSVNSSQELQCDITSVGDVEYGVQVYYDGFSMKQGVEYEMSFDIHSTMDRSLKWCVQINGGDYHAYGGGTVKVTSDVSHVSERFTMKDPTDPSPRLCFNMGYVSDFGEAGIASSDVGAHSVMLDNISIVAVNTDGMVVDAADEERPKIRVNQLGYKVNSEKTAVCADLADGDTSFKVVDAKTGKAVYEGKFTGKASNKASKETNVIADFTALTKKGTYKLVSKKGEESYKFTISDDVYDDTFVDVVKMFYLQRCGEKLTPDFAGDYAHASCHDTMAVIYGTDKKIDVSGGWHDAGDYGRYVTPAAKAAADLMLAYEKNPGLFTDNTGIPESGNGISDVLDEARYELEWILKMQDADNGGAYHKVTCMAFPGTVKPEDETEELVVAPVSNTATGDFAAVLALASRIYKDTDKAFADRCLKAAEKAFGYVKAHVSDPGFTNPKDITTGEYGDDNCQDEYFWAAAELYKATGKEEYASEAKAAFERQSSYGEFGLEKLTTYNVDMKKMAEIAVKLLMRRIRGEDGPYEIRYIDSEIIERCSVRTLDQK